MKLAFCVGILLVAGQCLATKNQPPAAQDAADAVLAVALKRALVAPKDLADFNLVDTGPEIVVRSSILNSRFSVGARALPKIRGKTVLLLSSGDIAARAAQRGDVYFVEVDNLKIVGNDATFTIGTGLSASPQRPVLCCCVEIVQYSRDSGKWVYRASKGKICS